MVKMKLEIENDAIFTLTEKETSSNSYYNLYLYNKLSEKTLGPIEIYDESLFTERYNEFKILPSETVNAIDGAYDVLNSRTNIFNLNTGFYNYTVKDEANENILETGLVLFYKDSTDTIVYTDPDTIHVSKNEDVEIWVSSDDE